MAGSYFSFILNIQTWVVLIFSSKREQVRAKYFIKSLNEDFKVWVIFHAYKLFLMILGKNILNIEAKYANKQLLI